MAIATGTKGLPPPPLRLGKKELSATSSPIPSTSHSDPSVPSSTQQQQQHLHHQRSISQPSCLSKPFPLTTKQFQEQERQRQKRQAKQEASLARSSSGRFRRRVASLTKSSKKMDATKPSGPAGASSSSVPADRQSEAHAHTHVQNQGQIHSLAQIPASSSPNGKAWQPRWAPKLRRVSPTEAMTAYHPASASPPLPPLPYLPTSPPPALQLDQDAFGRFSTTGLLDFNLSRSSFLDMRKQDRDSSDYDSDDSHATDSTSKPTLPASTSSPDRLAEIVLQPPTPATPATPATPSEPRFSFLRALDPNSSLRSDHSGSNHPLPSSSPALASLISSFPSPTSRGTPATHSQGSEVDFDDHDLESSIAMKKENSWDGGERWDSEGRKHPGEALQKGPTELPYLDMSEEEEEDAGELTAPTSMLSHVIPKSQSQPLPSQLRQARNPPPRPAPTMALPQLPPTASSSPAKPAMEGPETPTGRSPLKRLALEGSVSASPNVGGRTVSRQTQRPLILPSLRSSTSLERLTPTPSNRGYLSAASDVGRSPTPSNYMTASPAPSSVNSMILGPSSSTGDIARSLDIPREAIKQMLETTQHVWRSHNLGSTNLMDVSGSNGSMNSSPLPRSSSNPTLGTAFSTQGTPTIAREQDESTPRNRGSRSHDKRTSMSTIPYISSSSRSFEKQQVPGWAISKSAPEEEVASAVSSHSDTVRHRQTFVGKPPGEEEAAKTNFSRPIRHVAGDNGQINASASMPSLSASAEAARPQAFLQSPLILKSETAAVFDGFAHDDEEEILNDSSSESQVPFTLARMPARGQRAANLGSDDLPASKSMTSLVTATDKPMPELPQDGGSGSPTGRTLVRRNSDTVLNKYAPEFGKRAPGELHAWSVCIDDNGVPAIRPSPSAFHRPNCPLAGKNNATWQCGCRGVDEGSGVRSSISNVPRFGSEALSGQPATSVTLPSPGRNRSLSAGNLLDPARQAQLWRQVETNKELIRKHENEIAGLHQQVFKISSELNSSRPSLSSAFVTPELAQPARFTPTPAVKTSLEKPLPSVTIVEPAKPIMPTYSSMPFPSSRPPVREEGHESGAAPSTRANTLRGRIASLSKMPKLEKEVEERPTQSLDQGPRRLRSSSSTSSINKVFRFPWSKSGEKDSAFPEPTPYPVEKDTPRVDRANAHVPSSKSLPIPAMISAKEGRPLPAPPISELGSRDKKYPPSSRKYSFDTLHGPAFHSSVGSRHLRDRSGSSKSSSFGTRTSIFSNEGGEGHDSRFGTFPKFAKRWDSISSRGTSASARNSADGAAAGHSGSAANPFEASSSGTVTNFSTKASFPAPTGVDGAPMHPSSDPARRSKTPPPRRSSLLRKSAELAPATRLPIPQEFLVASKNASMAPISEQSEVGSPYSVAGGSILGDLEMSPASILEASGGAGHGRMSMSERFKTKGLTVPASLPLSSSQASLVSRSPSMSGVSPMLSQFPNGSADNVKSYHSPLPSSSSSSFPSQSPRMARQPLPMTVSHGTLTISRQPTMKS